MQAHSKIGASSYHRWRECPASVRLSEGVPSIESEYARIGTLAHSYAAEVLESIFFGKDRPNTPVGLKKEDTDAVRAYVESVKNLVKKFQIKKEHIFIEKRFDLSKSVYRNLFGTADCVLYIESLKKLIVIDYKHGAGIAVEVEHNEQLMYYGLGALLSIDVAAIVVELKIIQPRCDHSEGIERSWEFNSIELLDFAADLKRDAIRTEKEDAPINPGDHCRFCPALATKCPAVHEKALALAKLEFAPALSYDPKKLSETLIFADVLESFLKRVREFAYSEAQAGRPPPGFRLVEKRAMRRWRSEDEEILEKELKLLAPRAEFFKKSIVSPAQAEKLIPKNLRSEIEKLTVKESSGYKLAHESEGGIPLSLDPKDVFERIES